MKLFRGLFVIVNLICAFTALACAQADITKAMVKIYTVYNEYDYYEPWQMRGQGTRNGSGCIIEGKKILTNAHVVGDQTFIQVKRAGVAKKFVAKVEIVAHECDLAVLKVNDDSFFEGAGSLEFGALVEKQDKVAVYGFPMGGDELAITEGVVSRIEHQEYTHSKAYLLTCQIDAAINPGSSGGPVIKDDKIVGIAFQGGLGENIGYMVPVPVINHFLTDIKDGIYDGIPGWGIAVQPMENPDMRLKYNMSEEQTGLLVNKIYPDSPAEEILKPDDVILSIDGNNIENDGTIEFRANERTFFGYLVQNKYISETIKCGVLRQGRVINADITLTQSINAGRLVPHDQYDIAPAYFILGGLVFEPLTLNLLKEWGGDWYRGAPPNLLNLYLYGEPTQEQRQIIVLVKVLADEINVGYHDWMNNIIARVNGRKISTIKDLIDAFEKYRGRQHLIEDDRGNKLVLDKKKVDENNKKIMETYKIIFDRSEDLRK